MPVRVLNALSIHPVIVLEVSVYLAPCLRGFLKYFINVFHGFGGSPLFL